jgi:hypothetical protein
LATVAEQVLRSRCCGAGVAEQVLRSRHCVVAFVVLRCRHLHKEVGGRQAERVCLEQVNLLEKTPQKSELETVLEQPRDNARQM